MSLLLLCAAASVASSQALAGPFDGSVLRGSATPYADTPAPPPRFEPGLPTWYRWSGFYAGGHVGYTGGNVDMGNGSASLLDYILRNDIVGPHVAGWTTLPASDANRALYGGFVGYNYQAEEVVLSVEGNYSRFSSGGLSVAAADSMTRLFNDDAQAPAQHHYFYTATVSTAGSATLTDLFTFRTRAGFVLDRFLPYAFVGAAVGRVDISRSATVAYVRQDIPDVTVPPALPITPQPNFNFGPQTRSEQRDGVFAYGYTAGLGIDVAVLPNVFVRAEWEYVSFVPVQDFKIHLNTVRTGVAVKF